MTVRKYHLMGVKLGSTAHMQCSFATINTTIQFLSASMQDMRTIFCCDKQHGIGKRWDFFKSIGILSRRRIQLLAWSDVSFIVMEEVTRKPRTFCLIWRSGGSTMWWLHQCQYFLRDASDNALSLQIGMFGYFWSQRASIFLPWLPIWLSVVG